MIKLKNGAIDLPRELKKSWEGAQVFMSTSQNSIIINRIQSTPSLKDLRPKLQALGKMITQEEIDDAVRDVRAEQK
ncbi:MAG: hypothetical protein A3H70_05365 [Candidatus Komeilibacteria bacterium RIFCSPLOWO2_02_FULL_48_11]|uniref:SpoVT-AbrB domain-containing protein n=1 Tax=Candidatus Komeilibacteria bacterium RIFCSPLOWO2_02_FULL_48_11 TaxID=1798553 RepID=A0A1G2BRR1_9BACT|nr:MAG: hypothetical protein A3H70_05365 [Candidatus Komeilibacteria bacterium RIFCSPLOWO2_02_FULL_48_11]